MAFLASFLCSGASMAKNNAAFIFCFGVVRVLRFVVDLEEVVRRCTGLYPYNLCHGVVWCGVVNIDD